MFWAFVVFLTDVSSFRVSLTRRRDASFFLCGEVSRFVYKLCFRAFQPETVPLENDWFQLISFKTGDGAYMSEEEFLVRLKLVHKVGAASKLKADGIYSGKKSEKSAILKTADKIKEEFAYSGLRYISFLLGGFLSLPGLGSDLVKGLAAFDPYVLLVRPTDVALRHYDLLYCTFQLRSWVTVENESACRDEYLALVDHLRAVYLDVSDVYGLTEDLIDFLLTLDFLQTRPHLLHLLKLCCLCLTEYGYSFPSVTFGSINTTGYQGRLTDVILPCQSYFKNVPDSVGYCCSEASLAKFSTVSSDFGRTAFAADYDPWTFVDLFGRSSLYKSLVASYKQVLSGPVGSVSRPASDETSTVCDVPAVTVPSKQKRKRQIGSVSGSASSSVVSESHQDTSKN